MFSPSHYYPAWIAGIFLIFALGFLPILTVGWFIVLIVASFTMGYAKTIRDAQLQK